MSNTSTTDIEALRKAITEHELQRCQALVKNDIDALGKLIPQDLTHIHANGQVEDRAAYLKTVSEHLEFLAVNRTNLAVSPVGTANNVAIATGELQQTIRVKANGQKIDMRIMTSQVWMKSTPSSDWQQVLFQATNIA